MFKPKTLGLWANTDKSNFWEILPKIMDWSEQKDIQIYVTEKIQSHKKFIFGDAPKIDSSGKISEIVEKDLISIFEKNRIIKLKTKGKKFDPNLHQAMTEIEDDQSEAGTIVQEIQSGYMLGERLLRPALVGIARKKETKNEEKK